MKKLQTVYVNRSNAILVVVDVENEFCKPGGKLYTETSACVAPGVISAIQKLLVLARGARIPIIYIQSMRTLSEPEYTVFGTRPSLQKGTWATEIVDEIKPQDGDFIMPKFTHDPFYKTDLDNVLARLVPEPTRHYAIVTGGAVNVCLYAAVMGFHTRGYWTIVPMDSVYYGNDAGYERAIGQFSDSSPYPNIFLSRSDLIKASDSPELANQRPVPGS